MTSQYYNNAFFSDAVALACNEISLIAPIADSKSREATLQIFCCLYFFFFINEKTTTFRQHIDTTRFCHNYAGSTPRQVRNHQRCILHIVRELNVRLLLIILHGGPKKWPQQIGLNVCQQSLFCQMSAYEGFTTKRFGSRRPRLARTVIIEYLTL